MTIEFTERDLTDLKRIRTTWPDEHTELEKDIIVMATAHTGITVRLLVDWRREV